MNGVEHECLPCHRICKNVTLDRSKQGELEPLCTNINLSSLSPALPKRNKQISYYRSLNTLLDLI